MTALPTDTSARHDDPFPRQQARTRRFALGAPRSFTVSPDGARVVFLRSSSGTDPVNALHVLDTASVDERVVADPRAMTCMAKFSSSDAMAASIDDPAASAT